MAHEIIAYEAGLLAAWADLHNAVFAGQHNFWPVTARVLRRRIVDAPGFEQTTLLFARAEDGLAGFAHAGPGKHGPQLYAIGVRPELRRAGIGSALMAALHAQPGELRFDSRGMNAFWGNARGPQTCYFGLVEGIAVATDDRALAFFEKHGARRGPQAVNLRVTPQSLYLEPGRDARRRAEMLGYEIALAHGRCPEIGAEPGSMKPMAGGPYFTAMATLENTVAATCVGFATPELGPGRFGIFALNTSPEHRRRGLGSALAMQVLLEMQSGRFTACEVTTVPEESPGAMELYERLGFETCAKFGLVS